MILLTRFYQMQQELDDYICKVKNIDRSTDAALSSFYTKRVIALQVELAECCNDWQGFKDWKANNSPKPTLLEEYVDCLHFILSIGNLTGHSDMNCPFPASNTLELLHMTPLQMFPMVMRFASDMHEDDRFGFLLMSFFDLGHTLGFTWDRVAEAYEAKYQENIRRQETGY